MIVSFARVKAKNRLRELEEIDRQLETSQGSTSDITQEESEGMLELFTGRMGEAGFYTPSLLMKAKKISYLIFGTTALFVAFCSWHISKSFLALGIGAFIGFYIGAIIWLLYLKSRKTDLEREVLFRIPIALESMVLLVESGLGILPALENIVKSRSQKDKESNIVLYALHLVYQLASRGLPFSQALEMVGNAMPHRVFRHVLLHLDLSGTEGGELVPALRSLGQHAHLEWKLGVESRVKRLENLVVFPVFISVMGLITLAAAVPLVSVLNFTDAMDQKKLNQSSGTNPLLPK
jgi:Flp pilus assembly protein TadB